MAREVKLETVAAEIRAEHRKATASALNALEHAIVAGRLLVQAKGAVVHGEWLPWLAANCPEVSERTAQVYMRVSKTAPALLEDKSAAAADLTLRGALALTTTHKDVESVLPEPTTITAPQFLKLCASRRWMTSITPCVRRL